MHIAICDDEEVVLKDLSERIQTVLFKLQAEDPGLGQVAVDTYTTGESMIRNAEQYEAVFLDIDMPEIDGIEVGRQIHIRNPLCCLIMATGVSHRVNEGFQIRASRYLLKPFRDEEIEEALRHLLKLQIGCQMITVYNVRREIEIRQRDIRFVKSIDSYVEFAVQNSSYRKNTSIQQLVQELDSRIFCQISRGMLVNLLYVVRDPMHKGRYIMEHSALHISRRRQKAFEEAYRHFDLYIR